MLTLESGPPRASQAGPEQRLQIWPQALGGTQKESSPSLSPQPGKSTRGNAASFCLLPHRPSLAFLPSGEAGSFQSSASCSRTQHSAFPPPPPPGAPPSPHRVGPTVFSTWKVM